MQTHMTHSWCTGVSYTISPTSKALKLHIGMMMHDVYQHFFAPKWLYIEHQRIIGRQKIIFCIKGINNDNEYLSLIAECFFNKLSESPFFRSCVEWKGVPRRSDDLLPRNTTWYPHIRDGSWKKTVRYWVVLHVVGETTHFYERCTRDRMNRVIEIIRVFDASVTMSLEYFEKVLGIM